MEDHGRQIKIAASGGGIGKAPRTAEPCLPQAIPGHAPGLGQHSCVFLAVCTSLNLNPFRDMAKRETCIISATQVRMLQKLAALWVEPYVKTMRGSCKPTWLRMAAKWSRSLWWTETAACQGNAFRIRTCDCWRACCSAKLSKLWARHRWGNSLSRHQRWAAPFVLILQ